MSFPDFSTKAEARDWARRVRAAISLADRARMSRTIAERLAADPRFVGASAVLTYAGAKAGELDTRPVMEHAWRLGKRVLVPLTRPGGALAWSALRAWADLEATRLGLLEPRPGAVDLVVPDGGLCITPGLCFRADGHRIGFGGGYFDRFLAGFRGTPIALAPDAIWGVRFPVEPHDIPVEAVITETAIREARG
ncbi:MAG: 5-formyltetrahydrofolate cyclo-ligase [Candidatus Hydrogenedentes bacterium]|nr:5-formyltetrahydrofolate cyclo-ligase [Candidatus Hydrogenedentota bacterium]